MKSRQKWMSSAPTDRPRTNSQKQSDAQKKADDELWKFWRAKVPGIETDWKFWRAELVQDLRLHYKATLRKASTYSTTIGPSYCKE